MNKTLLADAIRFIDGWLGFKYDNSRLPGFSVAISQQSNIIFSKAYGYANIEANIPLTPTHRFRVASHSKMFTATAIMLLVEQGKVQLDDKVSKHLPWFTSNVDEAVGKITIRQLLSHSSGIIRDGDASDYWMLEGDFPDTEYLKRYIQSAKLILPTNEKFKYSNFGYSYLGNLIEVVSGQPYNSFVTTDIIEKLGLKNTTADLDEKRVQQLATGYTSDILNTRRKPYAHVSTNAMSPATGFCSTPEDLCRFGAAHFIGNDELLTDDSKREMQRVQWKINQEDEEYGLGLDLVKIGERQLIGHGGGFPGFTTNTKIDPKDQLVVTVFINAIDGYPYGIAKNIINAIDYFQTEGVVSLKNAALDKFEGRFFSNWGPNQIVRVGNKLVSIDTSNPEPFEDITKLSVVSDDELTIDDTSGYGSPGELIKFHFDDKGIADHIIYSGGKEYIWGLYKKKFIDR